MDPCGPWNGGLGLCFYGAEQLQWILPKFLDKMLYLDQVQMFERADGWAVVGIDPLRSMEQSSLHNQGARRHQPTPLPPAPSRDFLQRYLCRT